MSRIFKTFIGLVLIMLVSVTSYAQNCTDKPVINSFEPNTGFIGSVVEVFGANFDSNNPANNVVYFGATKAEVISATFGKLEVVVPVGASTAPISVTNQCNLTAISALSFNGIFCPTPLDETSYDNVAQELAVDYGAYNMLSQDLDLDGRPEVISSSNGGGISVAINNSTPGNLSFSKYEQPNGGGQSIVTADFDGDGLKDILWTYGLNRNISTGPGDIGLANSVAIPSISNYQVAAGDFNNDGKIDIIGIRGESCGWNQTCYYAIMAFNTSTGPGNISFGPAQIIANVGAQGNGLQAADIDGDGKVDFIASQRFANRAVSIRNTTPDGSFTFSAEVPEYWSSDSDGINGLGTEPYRSQLADFDKDGKIDFTACNFSGVTNTAIWRNISTVGNINFAPTVNLPAPIENYRIQVGDVDGDGYPDIVTKSLGDRVFAVYRNSSSQPGTITFEPRIEYRNSPAAAEVSGIVIGDLDGDFVPDIATSGINTRTIRFHRNTSSQDDDTAPTAIAQNVVVALSPQGTVTVTAEQVNDGSSDACGIDTIVLSQTEFTCNDIGENAVTLTVTDNAGNVSTATAIVNVQPAAIIVSGQTTVCQGETIPLTANQGDSYQWFRNGTSISGATNQAYTATETGAYTVLVTNAGGCSGISLATDVVVNENPTVDVLQGANTYLCSGVATLTASQSSIYQWMKDGVDIPNATQRIYSATTVGNYSVRVIDLFGCSAVSGITTVSDGAPEIDLTNNGGNVSTGATVNYGNVLPGVNNVQTVFINNTGANPLDISQINVNGSDAASFSISGAPTSVAANSSATFDIVFSSNEIRSFNATITVVSNDCDEGNITFNAAAEITCLAASIDDISQIDVNNDTDTNGAIVTYSANIQGDPSAVVSYSFSGATTGSGNGTGAGSQFNLGTTQVTISVSNACGNDAATFDVVVSDAQAPVTLAKDVVVQLDANGNATINPDDVNNGSTDNSGGDLTYNLSQTDFDCNDFSVSCSGSSIEFNGTGIASGANGDNIQNLGLNQLTMEAWVKPNGGTVNSIIRKAGDYDLYIVNNTLYAEVWYEGRASSAQYLYTGPSVPSTGWSHLAFTFDKANNGSGKFYVNGVETVIAGATRSITPDITLGIGGSTEFGQSFTGLIDDVRIWSTERTNAEINEFKDFCIDANSVGLEAYFKIEANEGTTLTDYSGNGNHLTISGTSWSTEGAPIGSRGVEVTLTATDAAGNSSAAIANVFVLDNIVPTVNLNGDAIITLNQNDTYTETAAAEDNCSATLAISGTVDTATAGAYTLTYIATDGSGNESASVTRTVNVLDVTPPVTLAKDVVVQLDANGNATINPDDVNNGSTDNSGGDLTYTLDQSTFDCDDLGARNVATIVSDNTWTQSTGVIDTPQPFLSVVNQLPAVSSYTMGATVQDPYGQPNFFKPAIPGASAIRSFGRMKFFRNNFELTGRPQSLRLRARVDNVMEIFINGVSVGIEGDFDTRNFSNSVYHDLFIDENGIQNGYEGGMQFDFITSQSILDLLQEGDNEIVFAIGNSNNNTDDGGFMVRMDAVADGVPVQLTATDASGNSSSAQAFVVVEDNIAPVIAAPTDISVFATSASGAVVNYPTPVGTDNCSATTALIAGFADGATFPLGTTVVTYTATDGSGNTASASFNVEVVGIAPEIVVTDITVSNDAGECGAIVNYSVTETTAIPASVITYDIQPGSSFEVGTVTVTAIATNAVGTSTKSFTVTVEDNEAPIAITQPLTVQLDADGSGSITAAAVDYGSNDACGIASLSLDNTTFDCSNVGANTVTLTVTDNNGNVSTAEATITVEDNIAPIAIAKPVTVQLDVNGNGNITAAAVDNGSSDACGIESIEFITGTSGGELVTNGSFDGNANGWVGSGNDGNGGFRPTGGNSGGYFILNASGQSGSDPSVARTINGLVVGNTYTLTGDYRNNYGCCGATLGQLSFGVDLDGVQIAQPANPGTTWTGFSLNFTATSTSHVIRFRGETNGTDTDMAIDNISITSPTTTLTASSLDYDCLNVGLNPVTILVTDVNGNVSTAEATITVEDNIAAEVITTDVTVELDANGAATITTGDINAGSNDACGIASMVLDITSFDCTNTGANVVTLTVTDNNGNVSSADATVTVVDVIAPTVITTDITVALDENGAYTITASDIDGGSFDNCAFDLTIDNNAFDCTTLGANTVNLTATDASGNITTLPATVTVIDNAAPTIVAQPITVELDENGAVSIVAAQVDGGTYDNCAVSSVTIDMDSFTCDNLGDNIVTITATDVNGNAASAPVVVTVVDVIAPTVGVQSISVDLDENGVASINPEDVLLYSEADVLRDTECDLRSSTLQYVMKLKGDKYSKGASYGKSKKDDDKGKSKKDDDDDDDKKDDDDDDKGDDDDDDDDKDSKYAQYIFDGTGGKILKRLDGSLSLSGVLVNQNDANDSYAISLELIGAYDYATWSSMDRKAKEVKYENYHLDWTYYTIASGSLTGSGINAGTTVDLGDYSYKEGFQLGNWANGENGDEGLRGKFKGTSDDDFKGELKLDVSNCELLPVPAGTVYTSDNCSIVDFSFNQDTFTCNDLNETTVMLTATDQSGNATTVPVSVTVNDRIAPVAVAQNITVSLGANGSVTVDPSLLDGGSTDNTNCALTFTLDRDTFDCDDITKEHSNGKGKGHNYGDDDDDNDPGNGNGYGHKKNGGHKVTLTVTDAAGNSSSATAYITVVDDEAPVISSAPITVVVDGKKKAYLSKYDVENAVTDNCKVKDVDFRRMKYDRSDAGMNSVQVTATDYSGNSTTGNVSVNVVDLSNYGKYVDMCYNGQSIRVKKNSVQKYLRKGASLGSCQYTARAGSEGRTVEVITDEVSFAPELTLSSYPNPTAGYTVISFSSQVDGPARVSILSTNGVQMASLFDDELVAKQEVEIGYEAGQLPSGIYIVRMVTAGEVKTIKLVVRK